jgi:hypothetical protein
MLYNKLLEIYKDIGWEMEQNPNESILSVTYAGRNAEWTFVATTDELNNIIVMFARLPHICPPEKYAELSVFIEKVNFGMSHGAWVMDREDGEVRFRVGVDIGAMELTFEYTRSLTLYTNMTMEYYLSGIRSIIMEDKNAQEAFDITHH